MDTFDYLSVLLSIVVGLGLSRVLTSFGELVLRRADVRFYWVTLLTAVIVFLAHVEFWWSAFGFREVSDWNFFSFLLLLLIGIALYLLSVLVLPDPSGADTVDLHGHYFQNHRWFFSTAAVYLLLNVVFDILVGHEPLSHPVRWFQLGFAIFIAAGVYTKNQRFHELLALVSLALFVTQITLLGIRIG